MKSIYINGQCYYQGDNGILLPAVTTVLKATQSPESLKALSQWRKKVGETQANRIAANSRSRGNALHKLTKEHLQGYSPKPENSFIQPYWDSVQSMLKEIDDIQLVEQVVPNYVECYAGKVDLVARYQGVPHTIEWTTAEEAKGNIDRLYGKPLQLAAYTGAVNRYYSDRLFQCKIHHGLIVVALPHREAQIFPFNHKMLIDNWYGWMNRLKFFQNIIAA
ncbi:exonuclease [Nostoc spongiaeforme FACHB-130]|uniref:Exonuclease n=1 Tax=Nostoc spongiaeforme FACHB-130 TaxID=1357510 RepID=A0ABR8G116_9NOSO|nr:exonuclease [Nostoc spongiaeforme]MBD2596901.1 exonuclease [Nostoc spongiaeforme FACHB-130]